MKSKYWPGHSLNLERNENWATDGVLRLTKETRSLEIMNEVEMTARKYMIYQTKMEQLNRREKRRNKEEGQV